MRIGGIGIATVNARGYDGSAWQNLQVESATYHTLRASLWYAGSQAFIIAASGDAMDPACKGLMTLSLLAAYNGSTWDRLRSDPNMHLCVNIGGKNNLAHGQVSVTDAQTTIKTANTSRKAMSIKNIGSNDVYLGVAGVTTANGYKLAPGESLNEIRDTSNLKGICATGLSTTICYWEE